jgi:hypothetical protein
LGHFSSIYNRRKYKAENGASRMNIDICFSLKKMEKFAPVITNAFPHNKILKLFLMNTVQVETCNLMPFQSFLSIAYWYE